MKIFIYAIAVVAVFGAGWYLVYPVFNVVERNDSSPLSGGDIRMGMEKMTTEEKTGFREAVEETSNEVVIIAEEMPASPKELARGDFVPSAHEVNGKAILIQAGNGKILRFEDFETINGSDLHIYLAKDFSGDNFIDLGPIRGTKGNINYELPEEIDASLYNKVLVWCVPFRVLFSYAELK